MPDEPLKHIQRPNPPWRDEHLTECGKPERDVAACVSGDEAVALVKKHGQQRAGLLLCMTCMSTANRQSYHDRTTRIAEVQDWDRDPVAVMCRFLERVHWNHGTERDEIVAELRAIGALVSAHREEFNEYAQGVKDAPRLSDLRARNQYGKQSRR